MSGLERRLLKKIKSVESSLLEATPGFVLFVYAKGKLKADLQFGKTYEFYDLASLTKIIFTASLTAQMVDQKKIRPLDRVIDHWPQFRNSKIRLSQLWTHTAGLPWWQPFFKTLKGSREPHLRWSQLTTKLVKIKQQTQPRAVYSDLDLWVIAEVLQRVRGQSLNEMWQEMTEWGWTGSMHFNLKNQAQYPLKNYAPTENCRWRRKILRGQVHDENTFALGGIAPHAGLFGRAEDVGLWALNWRKAWRGENEKRITSRTAQAFSRRQLPLSRGDWGWLFMKPTKGKASCGKHFSLRSFGHTGFTGTSLWMDPVHDRIVVLLSNRVYPTRHNQAFLRWRPWLHDLVCEELESN